MPPWQAQLKEIVGPERVLAEPEQRLHFSRDIFFWDDSGLADAVVQPRSVTELAAVLATAADHDVNLYTRGGGLSYSKGYVPTHQPALLVDLTGLNSVREINTVEGYLIAEAGCTWATVTEDLADSGFEIEFTAPFSGIHSTVGGAMSQNVPQGMGGVLGLEILTAAGQVVRTGSWGSVAQSPFFPDFGPNLTGLFLGDCGAFAIKTAAALKLRAKPGAVGYCSFAFETYQDMARAMIPLATLPFIRRPVGLDPFKSQNSIKVGFKEALKTVRAVAEQETGLKGLAASARFAAEGSRNFMAGVKWSLHLTITSDTTAGVALGPLP